MSEATNSTESEMTTTELNARMMDFRDAGLVSDNASIWEEVAPCDQERAIAWLEQQRIDKLKHEQTELMG